MAVINRVYSPLRTQLSMEVAEGTLTQEYDANNKIYTPDRRIRPTAILPVCGITDTSEIIESGIVNRYITDVKWYENGIKDVNLISPTSVHYKIDYSSETNNRGRITVYKNVNSDTPITLFFTANYADMVNGKVRRKVSFLGSVILSSSISASSPIVLKTETLRGTKYNPLSELKYMTLSADLYSGNTIIPAAYWWYKKENGQNNLITDYVGHNLRELQVPSASLKIGALNKYLCKVQDCRQDLTEVRNGYLQEEIDKISGYPRNLLAKQYFLDLNDEIKPGVVTEGEDADGKYICIPNPSVLRTYVGADNFGDLFSGKISFKENTVYVIRAKGKSIGVEGATATGFLLTIVYTDGKYITYPVSGINVTNEIVRTTGSGKTVSHISCTYGNNYPTYIYDIQITEEYNYNLIEGDTEEVTVTAEDNGTESNNYKYVIRKISKPIGAGKKITVSVGDVVNLKGEATEYSVVVYQKQENENQGVGGTLSTSKKTLILTTSNGFDSTKPCELYLYPGRSGATAGNSVKYSNVQLLEGEYAWNVLGEDVKELIVDAASEQQFKNERIAINETLVVGDKYTLDIENITNLAGEAISYTVFIQQTNGSTSTIVSNSPNVTKDLKRVTFTINDKYVTDIGISTWLVLYAGISGSTAGNTVQFKNIRLLQGETVLPSMPAYTPHFIPSAPDIEVESESIQLPEGYRPDVQGKTFDHEFALTSEMPAYNVKVVTPYGDDSDVISIPNNVKLFPAWIQVDVAGIGTLDSPGKYFSADWGNGLKGMNVLLDADDIGMGIQEVEPDVVEGMEYVRYAASGIFLQFGNLEDFVEGSRIVVEVPPNTPNSNAYISARKDGVGLLILYNPNGNVSLFIYGYNERMSTIIKGVENVIQRYELRIGATLEECQLFLNGKLYTGTFGNIENGGGNSFIVDADSRASLIEIYSPESVLLHKWDFEGSSIDEIFSDKADTENKIDFIKGGEYELIPV